MRIESEVSCGITCTSAQTNNKNNSKNNAFIERSRRLKALNNLKRNMLRAKSHKYTNQWYINKQNIQKLINTFI